MIEAIVQAAQIPLYRQSSEPFELAPRKMHSIIVGGTHLIALANLFPKYAVDATILIPTQLPAIESEMELARAMQLEETSPQRITGVGLARDLSGIDSDSADVLIICCLYPGVREEFLSQAWRIVKELGRVIIFTPSEIPITHLASHGVVAPKYFQAEGFYAGLMRKAGAIRANN